MMMWKCRAVIIYMVDLFFGFHDSTTNITNDMRATRADFEHSHDGGKPSFVLFPLTGSGAVTETHEERRNRGTEEKSARVVRWVVEYSAITSACLPIFQRPYIKKILGMSVRARQGLVKGKISRDRASGRWIKE